MLKDVIFGSLRNRPLSTLLTIGSIGLSVTLLLGVERIRTAAKDSFSNTVSGTDLIVGAKGGSTNLLLYSVFRLGNPVDKVSWHAFEDIAGQKDVAWAIPFSLGDSFGPFRVVGTDQRYFKHYKYGHKQSLKIETGEPFLKPFDVVIGADVGTRKGLKPGDTISLTHGDSEVGFHKHDSNPFKVSGILAPTGTPVDRSVYVTLHDLEKLHAEEERHKEEGNRHGHEDEHKDEHGHEDEHKDEHGHEDEHKDEHGHEDEHKDEHGHEDEHGHKEGDSPPHHVEGKHEIEAISGFFLKLKSPRATLHMKQWIGDYKEEPLMAIIPAVALNDLWLNLGFAEKALRLISLLVVLVGLITMLIAVHNSLNERRREMAILRSLGATPVVIFMALMGEALLITFAGILTGVAQMALVLMVAGPLLGEVYGLSLQFQWLEVYEIYYLLIIMGTGLLLGLIPSVRAYAHTLNDGLTIRL